MLTVGNLTDLPTAIEKPVRYFRGMVHKLVRKKAVNISKNVNKFTAKHPELDSMASTSRRTSARASVEPSAAPRIAARTAGKSTAGSSAPAPFTQTPVMSSGVLV